LIRQLWLIDLADFRDAGGRRLRCCRADFHNFQAHLTRIIHERFCCNRRSAALARETSLVNCERDKQDVRDRRDPNAEGRSSKLLF